jgi:CBS domain-containing protein
MTTIGELCARTVWISSPDEAVLDAARRMRDQHVGCLVVVTEHDGERVPIGILTDRDIVVRVLAEGRDAAEMRVADVMTKKLVKSREAEPIEEVVSRMRAFGVRRVPVVNRRDGLEGIVSLDDVLEYIADALASLATVFPREQERERTTLDVASNSAR